MAYVTSTLHNHPLARYVAPQFLLIPILEVPSLVELVLAALFWVGPPGQKGRKRLGTKNVLDAMQSVPKFMLPEWYSLVLGLTMCFTCVKREAELGEASPRGAEEKGFLIQEQWRKTLQCS